MHQLSQQQQQLDSLQRQQRNRPVNTESVKQIKVDQQHNDHKNLGFAGTSQGSLNCAQHSQMVQQQMQQQTTQPRFNSGPMGPGAGIFLNYYLKIYKFLK